MKHKITVENIKEYISELEVIINDINAEKHALITEKDIIEDYRYRNEIRIQTAIERCKKTNPNSSKIEKLGKKLYYIKHPKEAEQELNRIKNKITSLEKNYKNYHKELQSCYKILFDMAISSILKNEDLTTEIAMELIKIRENKLELLKVEKEKIEDSKRLSEISNEISLLESEISSLKLKPKESIIGILKPTILKPNIKPLDSKIKRILRSIEESSKIYDYYNDIILEQDELEKKDWYPIIQKIFEIENKELYANVSDNKISTYQKGSYDYEYDKTTGELSWTGTPIIEEFNKEEAERKKYQTTIDETKKDIEKYHSVISTLDNTIKELEDNINNKKDCILYANKDGKFKCKSKISKFLFRVFRKKQYKANCQKYDNKIKCLKLEKKENTNSLIEYDKRLTESEIKYQELTEKNQKFAKNNQDLFNDYELLKQFNELPEKIRKDEIKKYLNTAISIPNVKAKMSKCKINYFKLLKQLSKIKNLPCELINQIKLILENNIITDIQLDDIDFSNLDEESIKIVSSIFDGRNYIKKIDFDENNYSENIQYFDEINENYRKKYNYFGSDYEFFSEKLINDEIDMNIPIKEAVKIVKEKIR